MNQKVTIDSLPGEENLGRHEEGSEREVGESQSNRALPLNPAPCLAVESMGVACSHSN